MTSPSVVCNLCWLVLPSHHNSTALVRRWWTEGINEQPPHPSPLPQRDYLMADLWVCWIQCRPHSSSYSSTMMGWPWHIVLLWSNNGSSISMYQLNGDVNVTVCLVGLLCEMMNELIIFYPILSLLQPFITNYHQNLLALPYELAICFCCNLILLHPGPLSLISWLIIQLSIDCFPERSLQLTACALSPS